MIYDPPARLQRLHSFKDVANQLLPMVPRSYIDLWSITDEDALALSFFLDAYAKKIVVLDVGTFIGVSTFHFALQPTVTRVISVDPNPYVSEEINEKTELETFIDSDAVAGTRVLDIARASIAASGAESKKIEIHAGVIARGDDSHLPSGEFRQIEVPDEEALEGQQLLAFVDGLHTRKAVEADIEAILARNPGALILLHDCRHYWGPFVQAGVAAVLEASANEYRFRLLCDVSADLAAVNLGFLYLQSNEEEVEAALARVAEAFGERIGGQTSRERELMKRVQRLSDEAREAKRAMDDSREAVKTIMSSLSWRMTRPLRFAAEGYQRARARGGRRSTTHPPESRDAV